jgi:KUP system potassium uptake protein
MFGPVIVLWFGTLAATGAWQIAQAPAILQALDPRQAFGFLQAQGWHCSSPSAQSSWPSPVPRRCMPTWATSARGRSGSPGSAWYCPALALNYMGQGALLMREPGALENPFFHMFSEAWLIPSVILAFCAAVIASQAVISGAYSMTRQAIQLGFLPRMRIVFTSASAAGQIYMPEVNRVLLASVLAATVAFGSSTALAGAYGIAVTATMFITTLLTFFVVRNGWGYPLPVALAATGAFLAVDALLVVSCALKFSDGGWFPLVLGAAIFGLMATWKRGRQLLQEHALRDDPELLPLVESLARENLPRSPRTAVYVVADPTRAPQALLHNIKHNAVLHERNVVLTVAFGEEPVVPAEQRLAIESLGHAFWRVRVAYGFMETPDIPAALDACRGHGLDINLFAVSYFLSRAIIIPHRGASMARWRESLFATMARNAGSVAEFFPPAGELRGRAGEPEGWRSKGLALSSGDHRQHEVLAPAPLIAATPAMCTATAAISAWASQAWHDVQRLVAPERVEPRHPAGEPSSSTSDHSSQTIHRPSGSWPSVRGAPPRSRRASSASEGAVRQAVAPRPAATAGARRHADAT